MSPAQLVTAKSCKVGLAPAASASPTSQIVTALPSLAITHIFLCSISGLLASLKGVSFCAEPFEGPPFRVILSGSNIDRGRNYNCPCGWSKMWVIARALWPSGLWLRRRWLRQEGCHREEACHSRGLRLSWLRLSSEDDRDREEA